MVGKTNGKKAKRYEFKEGERIVGIKHKEAKPMYRYNLQLMIANENHFPTKIIEEIVELEDVPED